MGKDWEQKRHRCNSVVGIREQISIPPPTPTLPPKKEGKKEGGKKREKNVHLFKHCSIGFSWYILCTGI